MFEALSIVVEILSSNLSRQAFEIHLEREAVGSISSWIRSITDLGMVILISVVGSLLRRRLILESTPGPGLEIVCTLSPGDHR